MNSNIASLPNISIRIRTEFHADLAQELLLRHGGLWTSGETQPVRRVWGTYGADGLIHVRAGLLTFSSSGYTYASGEEMLDYPSPEEMIARLEELLRRYRPATFSLGSSSESDRLGEMLVGRLADALTAEGFAQSWGNNRDPVLDWGYTVHFFRNEAARVYHGPPPSSDRPWPLFVGEEALGAFIEYITGRSDVVPPPPAWTDDQVAHALGASAATLVRTMPGERIVRGTLRALFPGLIPPTEAITTAAIYDWLRVVLPPRIAVPAPAARVASPPPPRRTDNTDNTYNLDVNYSCTQHGRTRYSEDLSGTARVEIRFSDMAELAANADDEEGFIEALMEFAEDEARDNPPGDMDSDDRDYDDDEYDETTDVCASASESRCRRLVEQFLAENPTLAPSYEEEEEEEDEEEEEAAAPIAPTA